MACHEHGILCADMVLYGAGRLLGQRVFQYRWVNRVLSPEHRDRLEGRFLKHGLKFLLMARLLPPLRTGVFLIAGSMRYPFTYFLLADAIYGFVGVGVIFFGGTALLAGIHLLGGWLLLVGTAVVAAYLLYRYYRYLKKLELKSTAKVMEAVLPEKVVESSEHSPTAR